MGLLLFGKYLRGGLGERRASLFLRLGAERLRFFFLPPGYGRAQLYVDIRQRLLFAGWVADRLVGIADLVVRWGYSRQGVHKLSKLPDFPAPLAIINQGRTKVWRLSDFETFEANHRELYSDWEKKRKIIGFYKYAIAKKS